MTNRIGFLDLVSGAGKNGNGSEVAPFHVLKSALENNELANMLVTVFGDKDQKNIIKLRQSIGNMEGVEKLMYNPLFEKVVACEDLICCLQKVRYMPSLIMVEPFNVKDLNLELISAYIKEWNFECIFLLHYNQLERMIENPFKAKHLEMAFGKTAAQRLYAVADRLNSQQKENFIVNTFVDGLKSLKSCHSVVLTYYLGGDIYYLVFTTRYAPRYRLMKEIMLSAGYHETGAINQVTASQENADHLVQTGLFN